MLRTQTKIIGDIEFEFTQLGFARTRKLFVRLVNVAGPMLRALFSELNASASKSPDKKAAAGKFLTELGNVGADRIGAILGEFLEKLSDTDLEYLANEFGESTRFKGPGETGFRFFTKEDRELFFGGDGFPIFFQWLLFCLEVNYRGFFSGGSGLREIARSLGSKVQP